MDKQPQISGDCEPTSTITNELHMPVQQTKEETSISFDSSTLSSNNNSKLKMQQQFQYHQFRTPQQFVRQRKIVNTSLLSGKKNKVWNKRQNKTVKQLQQSDVDNELNVSLTSMGSVSLASNKPQIKADMENIHGIKSQIGGIHHYYNHRGGFDGSDATISNSLPPPALIEKLAHGHGHLKQQLYKKMLMHQRSHHHHILCTGAAHNTHSHTVLRTDAIGNAIGISSGSDNKAGVNTNTIGVHSLSCKDIGNKSCCLINDCNSASTAANAIKEASCVNSNTATSSIGTLSTLPMHYCCGRSKFFLPDKRPRKEIIIPPTKFLLGGNISDPLNLTSLQNEMSSTTSSNNNTPVTTPRQSPITTPPKVEVIIPPNIHDPLHLLDPVDSMEYEKQLTSPLKKRLSRGSAKQSKHPHRYRKNRKPKRRRNEPPLLLPPSFNASSSIDDVLPTKTLSNISNNINTDGVVAEVVSKPATNIVETSSFSIEYIKSAEHISSLPIRNLENNNASCKVANSSNETEASHKTLSNMQTIQNITGSTTIDSKLNPCLKAVSGPTLSPHLSNAMHTGVGGVAHNNTGEQLNAVTACNSLLSNDVRNRNMRLELHTTATTCSLSPGNASGGIAGGCGRKRKISESNNSLKNKKFHRDAMDKIVSPVVPQPGAWKRPPRTVPSGARKPVTRRSTSFSETDIPSPSEDGSKASITDGPASSDVRKLTNIPEVGLESSLSAIPGATSVVTGEKDLSTSNFADDQLKSSFSKASVNSENPTKVNIDSTENVQNTSIPPFRRMPKFRVEGAKYRYGNYDRYAGFRHLNEFMDVRLQVFQRHMELFQNKDILDIGCNVGHMTITIGQNLAPKTILGIDIDKEQIARARRNLALYVRIPPMKSGSDVQLQDAVDHSSISRQQNKFRRRKKCNQQQYLSHTHAQQTQNTSYQPNHIYNLRLFLSRESQKLQLRAQSREFFPISFPLTYGSLLTTTKRQKTTPDLQNTNSPTIQNNNVNAPAQLLSAKSNEYDAINSSNQSQFAFPRNVFFRCMNYVLRDESQLSNENQQYDVILCLSVTKWIHLNFGDAGLKLAFKRMFNQLRPGGKLILEAQNWASYKKKKNLTEDIYENYHNIEFFPNKFHEYLLSSEVGFSHSFTLDVPRHLNKGFCRPIQLYAKGDFTPNHIRWSDAYYPQTPYEAYRGIYATMPPRPLGMATGTYPISSSTRSQTYDTPHHLGGTSGPYSCRQTPMYQPTSQYYNPLETDSYQPSYDMEYLNHMYVFASPLYQTVWSPPASLRNSSSHTPLFGSVRDAELDGDGSGGGGSGSNVQRHRHVYPPNDDTSSPNANTDGAFNSIRDPDTDDSNQLPGSHPQHVYATNCGDNSSSPQVLHNHHSDGDDITIMLEGDEHMNSGNNNGFAYSSSEN